MTINVQRLNSQRKWKCAIECKLLFEKNPDKIKKLRKELQKIDAKMKELRAEIRVS